MSIKIKSIFIVFIMIILIFNNISLGLTDEQKDDQKKAEEIVDFYKDFNNWIFDDEGNIIGYKDKTDEDIKDDLEFLKETNEFTLEVGKGVNTLKYRIESTIDVLNSFFEKKEQQESDNKEREENNQDTNKQAELKDYSIEQMIEYYENHNNSLASLPETGNVRETWISKLKNTSEYKFYIDSTTQRDDALDSYKTGEKYYNMISSIDPSSNDERARNNPRKDGDDTIYNYPKNNGGSTSSSLDDMIGDADSFLSKADRDVITEGSLQSFSQTLYNILLTVGIITAVLVGLVIGIRFMIGGAEEKANIKELLVPYVVGCIVVFGAFAIWKIVVTILSTI